jgi:uncharacterized protein (UPF0332 family)
MSFSWREYVSLAEDLCGRTDASALRSSVSRAYYGAFCLCRNYLGLSHIRTGEVHKLVSQKLNASDDPDIFIAGQHIDELFKERKNCDYEGNHTITQNNAVKLVDKAKKVIAIIDDLES